MKQGTVKTDQNRQRTKAWFHHRHNAGAGLYKVTLTVQIILIESCDYKHVIYISNQVS